MGSEEKDKVKSVETTRVPEADKTNADDATTSDVAKTADGGKKLVHHVRPADVPSLFSTSHVTWLVVGIIIGAVLMALAIKTSIL